MNDLLDEWRRKAVADFATAQREITAISDPNYDAVCFHAQQCVEKLMKAVLIKHGILPPKTHDLAQLSRFIEPVCPGLSLKTEDLYYLTRAAVEFRYPGESADELEAREALDICTRLRSILLPILDA